MSDTTPTEQYTDFLSDAVLLGDAYCYKHMHPTFGANLDIALNYPFGLPFDNGGSM
ncbi:MAG: hypothetical protein NC350_03605 [Corallococcus sp.]|nr:hypothetical protein [Corallococcus sp.]